MTILVVCGLRREARIAAGEGVATLACGGDAASLRLKLDAAMTPDTRGIVSFGIAAGLAPSLKSGDCVMATEIVAGEQRIATDAQWRTRMQAQLPDAIAASIAGCDAVATTPAAKAELLRKTGAIAADMESHIAAAYAQARGLPFACLRTMSDPWNSALPSLAANALTPDGRVRHLFVLASLLTKPGQIPALLRAARESKTAFAALLRCRRALGLRLLGPD